MPHDKFFHADRAMGPGCMVHQKKKKKKKNKSAKIKSI